MFSEAVCLRKFNLIVEILNRFTSLKLSFLLRDTLLHVNLEICIWFCIVLNIFVFWDFHVLPFAPICMFANSTWVKLGDLRSLKLIFVGHRLRTMHCLSTWTYGKVYWAQFFSWLLEIFLLNRWEWWRGPSRRFKFNRIWRVINSFLSPVWP